MVAQIWLIEDAEAVEGDPVVVVAPKQDGSFAFHEVESDYERRFSKSTTDQGVGSCLP